MKLFQAIIGIPSLLLFFISISLNYKTGLFIALGGCFFALTIRQIRLHKYAYRLGHPDRHSDKFSYDDDDFIDPLDQAETYEIDEKEHNK
ncbi:hypothetical protein SAMN05216353_12525 [Halobacillus alkaliphilus]|uniref:Uncharacterized protein n=1 Tax=Halobacillus alkaliphilus TaxID=396056 RepID=A0A1I2PM09_9BACI|nr:hypothetical protein [Halobacillus alkaliphilus]SFG15027.1 hypothetical protein SAMN05216353_12525 [Halobacillus alkaliphilus]